jgi:uncharacterized protein
VKQSDFPLNRFRLEEVGMKKLLQREKVHFSSGNTDCAAWHYPGTNGACVVMTGGMGVNKEPGTDRFAVRFQDSGFAVLAFDYRHLGESGGQPRQVVRIREQLADWQAALDLAPTLSGVDPTKLVIWGFSLSGGHICSVAARNPQLAAAIAQTPLVDGKAVTRNAARYQTPLAMLRLTGWGILDALGSQVGRPPRLVPLAGEPGVVAVLATPDAMDGGRILNPENRYPDWRQEIAARSALRSVFYRPGRYARHVQIPLLVLVCNEDQSALAEPAARVAKRAPRAELVRLPGGHYAPFMDMHERAVDAELSFLRRHVLHESRAGSPRPGHG